MMTYLKQAFICLDINDYLPTTGFKVSRYHDELSEIGFNISRYQ